MKRSARPPMRDPDEDLVRRVGAGDKRAAAELVRRHLPKMVGLARRMLGNQVQHGLGVAGRVNHPMEDVDQGRLLLAGLIARAILPGTKSMGLIATTGLGVVGSFVGGIVSSLISSRDGWSELHPTGLVFSVIGALLVLLAVGGFGRRVRA